MSANATEVEAGRLAQERAASHEVRHFGQRMVTDHTVKLDALVALAAKYGLDPIRGPLLPQQPTAGCPWKRVAKRSLQSGLPYGTTCRRVGLIPTIRTKQK